MLRRRRSAERHAKPEEGADSKICDPAKQRKDRLVRQRRVRVVSAEPSFEEFVASCGDSLKKLAHMTLGDPFLAEDATQATLLKILQRWGQLDSPRAYARRVLLSECIDRQRLSARERLTLSDDWAGGLEGAHGRGPSATDRWIVRDALWQRVKALPARQRAVLALRYFEGLPDEEIAEVLAIGQGTVRSTASRGCPPTAAPTAPVL